LSFHDYIVSQNDLKWGEFAATGNDLKWREFAATEKERKGNFLFLLFHKKTK
jgi:hypothetical protein